MRANFFPVKVPKGPLFEYDVALQPAASNKRLKRRIFQLAEETTEWRNAGMTGKVAHDHSAKLISCFKLPQPLEIKIAYTEEGEETAEKKRAPKQYVMAIKFIQPIETQALIKCVVLLFSCSIAPGSLGRTRDLSTIAHDAFRSAWSLYAAAPRTRLPVRSHCLGLTRPSTDYFANEVT